MKDRSLFANIINTHTRFTEINYYVWNILDWWVWNDIPRIHWWVL